MGRSVDLHSIHLEEFLEKALEAEMEAHLDEDERKKGNKRKWKG